MNSDKIGFFLLEQLGFHVDAIPTSNKKEADYLVTYNNARALIEVKLKEDDPNLASEKEESLSKGEVFVAYANLGRNETLSGIIRYASKQLESSSDKEHDFRIILFIASGINSKTKADQFKDTIYGSTKIIETEKKNPKYKTCYFFRNSDFYRRKSIDAAIVAYTIGEAILADICLNTFSPRYELIKTSEILLPFQRAIIDPISEEKNGTAYILDGEINRKKSQFEETFSLYDPALIYLAEKYKTKPLIKLDFQSPEITIRY